MSKLRIIVGGMVGQFPLGGVAWDYFHYVLGLHQLGHDVYYHEDTWVWPFDPVGGHPTATPEYSGRFIKEFFERHAPEELRSKWHYLLMHETHYGMSEAAFDEVARTADVFINVSGACFFPEKLNPKCVKVWMDTDPGYNQIRLSERPEWAENIERWISQVRAHDRHLTYAENIYGGDCLLPRLDFDWIPTRPIATLPQWAAVKAAPIPEGAPLTTVMTWDYFKGALEYRGARYHGKPPEYEKFRSLPSRVGGGISLAVAGPKTPRGEIEADGFGLIEGATATLTAESYQEFIAKSAGEWSVAKNVFVGMRTGWFSCRTACYLAAGRPAVVQDTGWSKFVPPRAGLHAFETMEEAVAGVEAVRGNYAREREGAYGVARDYLSPEAVLPGMLEGILRGKSK